MFTLISSPRRHSFQTIAGVGLISFILIQPGLSLAAPAAKTVAAKAAVHRPGAKANSGSKAKRVTPHVNRNAILQELNWLNQRLSIPADTLIQWASQNAQQLAEQNQANVSKKRGWFSSFVSSFSAGAVQATAQ